MSFALNNNNINYLHSGKSCPENLRLWSLLSVPLILFTACTDLPHAFCHSKSLTTF